jgi:3-carboxy-cis,cis-muconate cycloisomerase
VTRVASERTIAVETVNHNRPSDGVPSLALPLLDLYGDPDLNEYFGQTAHVEAWLEVERELAAAQADVGLIPEAAAREIKLAAVLERIDLVVLRERTQIVGYPILPLIEQVASGRPDSVGRFLHWGATTQDIMDTGDALRYRGALEVLAGRLQMVGDALAELTKANRSTVMAGRTHGQHAVPTTLGAKTATWLDEFGRHVDRTIATCGRVATVELFGAAGTSAAMGPASAAVRAALAQRLGLGVREVPGHTTRDDLAELAFVLGSICATSGKVAREVTALARTEIGELRESDGFLRGASSTMPQKQNPIYSEAIIGLSSVAIHQVPIFLSSMQAVHERATGEWQAEWDTMPLLFALTAAALALLTELLAGLQVDRVRMRANLELDGGQIMAEAVMMAAAPLVGRDRAHALVYSASTRARHERMSLADTLRDDLSPELQAQIDLEHVLAPGSYTGDAEVVADAAVQGWLTHHCAK